MNPFDRIYLLLWKNIRIKLRHPLVLFIEISLPCLFSAILTLLRVVITFKHVDSPTIYTSLPVDNFHLLDKKTVLYSPTSTQTDFIMKIFQSSSTAVALEGFDTEQELSTHYMTDMTNMISCGVIFTNVITDKLEVKLRFPFAPHQSGGFNLLNVDSFTWLTARLYPPFQEAGPRSSDLNEGGPPEYYNEGFLYVQHHLAKSIAIYHNPNVSDQLDQIRVNVQRFPYPPFIDDRFLFSLQFLFPLILMLSFIYPSVNLTKSIVHEKEERLQEMMKMMGLSDWIHWTSWFTTSFGQSLLSAVAVTILLCVPLSQGQATLTKSNPVIVFLFFVLYILSSISFCFFLSTLFTRANNAGVIAGAVYFVSILPFFQIFISYNQLSYTVKMATGLIFNTNMALGCMLISMWESQHIGVQWSNLLESARPDDDFPLFSVFIMFAIDSIVYLILALYIQNVFPGKYGYAKKWNYFLDSAYWKCNYFNRNSVVAHSSDFKLETNEISTVKIDKLSKTYDKGKTFAVNQLSLNIEQNEITVLLGHNGAGKTTLMSILCGQITPTSGGIKIGPLDLTRNLDKIRKSLGICPQFDILFDNLTVREHFWFYCKLKNIDDRLIQLEIDKVIKMLDLVDKQNNLAYTLSGGMKRKLSVGIALVGGSKFVLLDEATSGMDASARRFIWELLLKEKKDRSILLSTHFMEEADVLGDKIAIIEHGTVKCFGSPMDLKKQYGMGYLLKLAVQEDGVNLESIDLLIRSHIDKAKLLSSVGTEITYSLAENESDKFENLFNAIEDNMTNLCVMHYGISVTTIEEVFLRVGDYAKQGTEQFNNLSNHLEADNRLKSESIVERIHPSSLKMTTGVGFIIQIYKSLFMKKLLFFIRNPFLMFAQIVLPSILLFVSIMINSQLLKQTIVTPGLEISSTTPYKQIQMTTFYDSSKLAQELSNTYESVASQGSNVQFNKEFMPNQTAQSSLDYLIDFGRKHESRYNLVYLLSAIFHQDGDQLSITALFNNQVYHTAATSISLIDNTLLRYLLRNPRIEMNVWNEPFPSKASDKANSREFSTTTEIQLSISVLFSSCFLLASFVILLVKEKSTSFRHIQQIAGLRLFHYWSSNFLLDMAFYIISVCGMVMVVMPFKTNALDNFHQMAILAIVYLLNGFSALPCIYIFSIFFTDPATAYVRVSLYLLIASVTTFLIVLILKIPDFNLGAVSKLVDQIILLLPLYGLPMSVYTNAQNYNAQQVCLADFVIANETYNIQKMCHDPKFANVTGKWVACCKDRCHKWCYEWQENYFSLTWPGIGQYMLAFIVQGILFWTILTLLELDKVNLKWFKHLFKLNNLSQIQSDIEGDDDVQAEEQAINTGNARQLAQQNSMVVQNLAKKYGNFCAVNGISFSVRKAECFGLLGINGAGKTTTFKMITGAISMTSGNVWINGNCVNTNMSSVYKDIGYCPQFDGLLDQLTGRETLRIISMIRGIDSSMIDGQINALSQLLYFAKHIDKKVNSYSGGTKRKLSFAISIIGNPLIVFMDEPTTGLDPVSRRCLWNAIQIVRAAGSSIVLTSHSMEECEALCSRLLIMVNAKIRCLGSPLHLKQKYGAGYIVQIKLKQNTNSRQMSETLELKWNQCRLESEYNGLLTYRIETSDVKLSSLFGVIERIKGEGHQIEDYSICQTSIERIFLQFADKQM